MLSDRALIAYIAWVLFLAERFEAYESYKKESAALIPGIY